MGRCHLMKLEQHITDWLVAVSRAPALCHITDDTKSQGSELRNGKGKERKHE